MRTAGKSWEGQRCQQRSRLQWAREHLSVRLSDLPLKVQLSIHPLLPCEPRPHLRAHAPKLLPGGLSGPHFQGTFSGLRSLGSPGSSCPALRTQRSGVTTAGVLGPESQLSSSKLAPNIVGGRAGFQEKYLGALTKRKKLPQGRPRRVRAEAGLAAYRQPWRLLLAEGWAEDYWTAQRGWGEPWGGAWSHVASDSYRREMRRKEIHRDGLESQFQGQSCCQDLWV